MIRKHISTQTLPTWMDDAACADKAGDLWYEDNPRYSVDAKAICKECPAVAICLRWAIDTNESWGVWGGLTAKERDNLVRRVDYRVKKESAA